METNEHTYGIGIGWIICGCVLLTGIFAACQPDKSTDTNLPETTTDTTLTEEMIGESGNYAFGQRAAYRRECFRSSVRRKQFSRANEQYRSLWDSLFTFSAALAVRIDSFPQPERALENPEIYDAVITLLGEADELTNLLAWSREQNGIYGTSLTLKTTNFLQNEEKYTFLRRLLSNVTGY